MCITLYTSQGVHAEHERRIVMQSFYLSEVGAVRQIEGQQRLGLDQDMRQLRGAIQVQMG